MEIAKRIGPCNLVFFSKNENWENVFKQRLERIFDQNNMDMKDFVVFLPWVNPGQFKSILSQADLYLDSLGFSGFNTAIQALECGLPVISLKGRFLRASFASGMLTKMGMQEWVAVDEEDYIKKAQDILSNPSLRAQISNQLIDNVGTLLGDMEPVRAFEDFMRFALGVNGQSNHL
jgi:predicted O-linked N-acetylglucosamine transferase (SPINDLY family)